MNIYSSVDSKNIDKIIVLFYSCYINSSYKNKLKFYIITDENYDEKNIKIPDIMHKIIEIKSVTFTDKWNSLLDDFNNNFYQGCTWCKNKMNFARFLFFETFPDVDRVVYLDWDMIVQEDIFQLINEYNSLENMIVSKISDKSIFHNVFNLKFKGNIYFKNNNNIKSVTNQLASNISKLTNTPHFCAGFYIVSKNHFDLNYLENHIIKLIEIQKKYKCFNFGTQSIMNLMHLDNRLYVDRLWNFTPEEDLINKIKIIHWNGKDKPWKDKDIKRNEIWWSYQAILDQFI